MRRSIVKLAAAAATLLASSSVPARTDPPTHFNNVPPSIESKAQAVAEVLRSGGYEVARGYWKTFHIDECKWAIHVIGNCYGNNPTAPYVIPVVPPWRDEYVDRSAHLAFGPLRRGYVASYRLAEREAIVVLAKLPPKAAYFSLQTYVFTRTDAIDPLDPVHEFVSVRAPEMLPLLFGTAPDPSRVVVFSSIGNTNNHVTMTLPGELPPWGEERYIVITPDADLARDITAALARAGVAPNRIFVEPVSPDLVRLGVHAEADDLVTLARYAMPESETSGDEWRRDLPLAVLRVRDMKTAAAIHPYSIPAYDPRSADSEQWLAENLEDLVAAVKEEWGQEHACDKRFVVPYLDIDLVGQHCLGWPPGISRHSGPMNCLGDTQDTDTYRISPPFMIDPPGTTIAVAGSLATETGNATYVSVSVNRFEVLEGTKNLSQDNLAGSAKGFGVDNAEKLYVFYLSRQCPTDLGDRCFNVSEKEVPAGEVIKIMQRNYMKPGTARGPDPGALEDPTTPKKEELLLRPRLIWLDSTGCPQ
jgi:hypothetical protein